MKEMNLFLKKTLDFLGSFFGIVLLSPLLLIIAIMIKIDSSGPIFFKQDRIGKDGVTFEIIKFRTMVTNAEKLGDGLSIKSKSDSRITKVGSFLRNTSLDELPQLFNVIKGDMSLVGPRPPVTYHPYKGFENYPKWTQSRFKMLPGVTGLAQITVRNSVSWEKRIEWDVKYINTFTFLLDIKIIIKTILKLFKSEDIYMDYDK
ncbi:sugar transferase [Aerococcaceae bacterium DSM 111021]|nr:sugar transferase [Aerococcaceae bacterium DSM 111021]